MGDLRDQLKKAKLLSEKEARRLAHEQRVERKEKGREGLEREQAERREAVQRKLDDAREADRRREEAREAERQAAAERTACLELVEGARRPDGRSTWFFQLPDGRVPGLRIDEADRHNLQGGHLCVVARGSGQSLVFGLMSAEHGRRVHRTLPERVVWAAPGVLG